MTPSVQPCTVKYRSWSQVCEGYLRCKGPGAARGSSIGNAFILDYTTRGCAGNLDMLSRGGAGRA